MHRLAALAYLCLAGLASGLAGQFIKLNVPFSELEARARTDSNDAEAHYELALGHWSRKRFDDAERALRHAVVIEPRFAEAWLALGFLPYGRRPKLFEEELKGRVPIEWREPLAEGWRLRRHAFLINPLLRHDIIGAIVPLRGGVITFDRTYRLVVVWDPFEAFVRGSYAAAFQQLNQMIGQGFREHPPDSIPETLLWYRGLSALHVGANATAIADFKALLSRALRHEDSDSMIRLPLRTNDHRYLLALAYHQSYDWLAATAMYQEALANDLGLYMAHVQLGRMYEKRGFREEAVEAFREAAALNPNDPSLLLDLGVVLRDAGRLVESEAVLRQAAQANPRDSRVRYHLARTLEEAGRVQLAKEAYDEFLALAPRRYEAQIADAKRRLTILP